MPELAEVETHRRALATHVGEHLHVVGLDDRRPLPDIPAWHVTDVLRHGKLLGVVGDPGVLTVHLRMTGRFSPTRERHTRAILRFSDGTDVFLVDPRGFGRVEWRSARDWHGSLGPDLLDEAAWEAIVARRSGRAVKAVLLDQGFVAGIGNYMADESLFAARVHPRMSWDDLARGDRIRVLDAARTCALRMLDAGGVSLSDYRTPDGSLAAGQDLLVCYGRAGRPCERCATPLARGVVAGRGTTWCPTCQVR